MVANAFYGYMMACGRSESYLSKVVSSEVVNFDMCSSIPLMYWRCGGYAEVHFIYKHQEYIEGSTRAVSW